MADATKLDAVIAGKYALVRLLGKGGMGAVYEARHRGTKKRCAVKVLRASELSGDAESVRRFFREARAAGMIECEHVVSALDSGVDEHGRVYYVMEFLLGEDLSQTLARLGRLTPSAAVKVALQAARGLASAHGLQIVHRDIKPANLFIAQQGQGPEQRVKILDFGVAKVKMEMFEESAGTLTQGGSLVGTLQYMSPAQLRGASAIDGSADIWSLGVVLYECLTGQSPWGNTDGIGELVTAILTRTVPPVQEVAPWVPPAIARVVQRATSAVASERFESAQALCDELTTLAGGDTRIYANELRAPSADERAFRAEPLVLVEAEEPGAAATGAPLAASVRPRNRRPPLTLLALGAVAAGVVVGSRFAPAGTTPEQLSGLQFAARLSAASRPATTAQVATMAAPTTAASVSRSSLTGPYLRKLPVKRAAPVIIAPASAPVVPQPIETAPPVSKSALEVAGGTVNWRESDNVPAP